MFGDTNTLERYKSLLNVVKTNFMKNEKIVSVWREVSEDELTTKDLYKRLRDALLKRIEIDKLYFENKTEAFEMYNRIYPQCKRPADCTKDELENYVNNLITIIDNNYNNRNILLMMYSTYSKYARVSSFGDMFPGFEESFGVKLRIFDYNKPYKIFSLMYKYGSKLQLGEDNMMVDYIRSYAGLFEYIKSERMGTSLKIQKFLNFDINDKNKGFLYELFEANRKADKKMFLAFDDVKDCKF